MYLKCLYFLGHWYVFYSFHTQSLTPSPLSVSVYVYFCGKFSIILQLLEEKEKINTLLHVSTIVAVKKYICKSRANKGKYNGLQFSGLFLSLLVLLLFSFLMSRCSIYLLVSYNSSKFMGLPDCSIIGLITKIMIFF